MHCRLGDLQKPLETAALSLLLLLIASKTRAVWKRKGKMLQKIYGMVEENFISQIICTGFHCIVHSEHESRMKFGRKVEKYVSYL